jgi:hypothetical protein
MSDPMTIFRLLLAGLLLCDSISQRFLREAARS